jgi:hypothetical protein
MTRFCINGKRSDSNWLMKEISFTQSATDVRAANVMQYSALITIVVFTFDD